MRKDRHPAKGRMKRVTAMLLAIALMGTEVLPAMAATTDPKAAVSEAVTDFERRGFFGGNSGEDSDGRSTTS